MYSMSSTSSSNETLRTATRKRPALIRRGAHFVKDYSELPPLRRLLARWQLGREERAYRRLAGLAGIPRFIERSGPHAIVLELVPARHFDEVDADAFDGQAQAGLDQAAIRAAIPA